ncbi:MAG: DMT family protein [Rudaea sp.]|nr:DMT family protein [Rudaea sp.]MBR0344792.1 DMT family protein [Rudaea sp.]
MLNLAQLKILQELITLCVFAPFVLYVMKIPTRDGSVLDET